MIFLLFCTFILWNVYFRFIKKVSETERGYKILITRYGDNPSSDVLIIKREYPSKLITTPNSPNNVNCLVSV